MEMIINWVKFEEKVDSKSYTVGATDKERWDYEKEVGAGDARTLVWATYTVYPHPWAPDSDVSFMSLDGDPAILDASYHNVKILMELAKFLAKSNWTEDDAREVLFGTRMGATSETKVDR